MQPLLETYLQLDTELETYLVLTVRYAVREQLTARYTVRDQLASVREAVIDQTNSCFFLFLKKKKDFIKK